MQSAAFIDRDGTLNVDREGHTHRIEDLELYPGVVEGMAMLAKTSLRLIVVSNQSGIARGLFSAEEAEQFNTHLTRHIEERGGRVDAFYLCPHAPEAGCNCRKPRTGLLQRAAGDFDLDLGRCYMIGDKASDVELGRRAGCRAVLVKTGYGGREPDSPIGRTAETGTGQSLEPDYVADGFQDAASWVFHRIGSAKIKSRDEIRQTLAELRAAGKTVVTCNGSFDVFHTGHLKFLQEAKAQGDVLIVGVNSDDSIKRYKSPDRPIIGENDRAEMMAGFECVDYVTVFDETDPRELLETIRPNVHVNGAEYGADCIEAPLLRKLGARLHLIKSYGGLSTTEIIERIKKLIV